MKYTPRRLTTNVNVSPTSPLKELAILVGGILAIVVSLYLLLGLAVDLIAPSISADLEKKLAAPFVHNFEKLTLDDQQALYVQSLVDDLQSRCTHLPYDFKVHIVDSQTVNAAALPEGHILVFKGLLEKVSSENELVFVLGHELGHYANRDHLRGLGRGLVLLTISVALLGSDNAAVNLISGGLNITEMGFSRKQEMRADTYGLEALQCAFGHVTGATDFFSKMSDYQDPGRWGHYFASHPENRRRITQLEKLATEHGYPEGELRPLPQ